MLLILCSISHTAFIDLKKLTLSIPGAAVCPARNGNVLKIAFLYLALALVE